MPLPEFHICTLIVSVSYISGGVKDETIFCSCRDTKVARILLLAGTITRVLSNTPPRPSIFISNIYVLASNFVI